MSYRGPFTTHKLLRWCAGWVIKVGYDKLVKSVLDQDIDKTSRFTDWSKRPLSNRQLLYALDDVIYLAQLYPIMRKKLESEKSQSLAG